MTLLRSFIAAALLLFLATGSVRAFPPAPHHLIYGLVRDEMGEPLTGEGVEIFLETAGGITVPGIVTSAAEPGLNYEIKVPMDSGITSDAYKPTALSPTVPFRIKVRIAGTTYLPLQMRANYVNLGKPALSTRIDLTLGEDLDNDGLPDAWERALLALTGSSWGVGDLKPGDDYDGDGMNNLQEYIAGTYAFDPQDGFRLEIDRENGLTMLKFLAIPSRVYSVYASTNLQHWMPVPFRLRGSSLSSAMQTYASPDVRLVQVEPVVAGEIPVSKFFFKAQVQ